MTIVRWAACLFVFGAAVLVIGACGGAPGPAKPTLASQSSQVTPTSTSHGTPFVPATAPASSNVEIKGYVESDTTEVIFLNLAFSGTSANGQMTAATADPTADSGVKGSSAKFTAQVAGSAITLDFGSVQWTGKTTSNGLALLIPNNNGQLVSYSFSNATSDDYNAAVARLAASVTSARAQQTAAAASATAQSEQEAATHATATAQAGAQLQARIDAEEQQSCAAIGGHVDQFGYCGSNSTGKASNDQDVTCGAAQIPFQADGSIAEDVYDSAKADFPGCFK